MAFVPEANTRQLQNRVIPDWIGWLANDERPFLKTGMQAFQWGFTLGLCSHRIIAAILTKIHMQICTWWFFLPYSIHWGKCATNLCTFRSWNWHPADFTVVTAQKNSIQCVDKMCEDARYRNPLQIFHAYKSAWKCECSLRASLFM